MIESFNERLKAFSRGEGGALPMMMLFSIESVRNRSYFGSIKRRWQCDGRGQANLSALPLSIFLQAFHAASIFYYSVNILADLTKPTTNIRIHIPDNLHAERFYTLCAQLVFLHFISFIMLRTVQLYRQPYRRTVKIYNIFRYHKLTPKGRLIHMQIIIPKVTFLFGHILTQILSQLS